MANKEYKMLFQLSAQVGKDFGSAFSAAQAEMTAVQKELGDLNRAQGDISAYLKQQQAVENTTRKLADLKQQHDNIQRELQETEGFSSALENKMIDKNRAIDETNRKLASQTEKLDALGQELREAGIDTGNLGAESDKLRAKMDALAEENARAAKEAQTYGVTGADAIGAVGSALVAAGVAEGLKEIYEAYKECVDISAEFEATMSTVEALSGANAEELASLEAEAKRLGATTEFTETQVSEAMTYMGMAGWDASQMLAGMNGVIKLASASGEELATVSDIVTDNLTAFGMAANETARFSDVLAAAATGSNTSVSVMGETFKKAGPVAGALGYSIEDVAVATGLMANAGVKGSRAGTALSNTFTGLLEGVTLTSAAMGEVEFSAQNADGTMKTFRQTVEGLRAQFDGMTEAERTANAMAIAGKQGYAGLLAILNATDADYNKLTNSINNCSGAAEKMAAIKLDNYKGQVTLLNSAMDALKTTIGDQFRPQLTQLAKVETDVISGVQKFAEENPVVVKSVMALTAEAGALLGVYTAYTTVKKVKNNLDKVSNAMRLLETAATVKQTAATAAETTATVGATAAQNALNASMLANPATWVVAGVAALTVAVVALTSAEKNEADEARELTAASREQYDAMQDARRAYDDAKETYGENSEQAEYLRWRVDELTGAYESGRQTVAEHREEIRSLTDELGNSLSSYRETVTETNRQETASLALVHRLGELAGSVNKTAAEEAEMKAIIAELNEEFPDLNLSMESVSKNQPDFVKTVEGMVKARAQSDRTKAAIDGMTEATKNIAIAEESLTRETAELAANQDRLAAAETTYENMYGQVEGLAAIFVLFTDEYREMKAASEAVEESQKNVEDLNATLREAEETYETSVSSLQTWYEEINGATQAEQGMNGALQTANETLTALTASYTEAYNAALESVQGQFALWTQADEVVAVSAADINAALESQAEYWSDYHRNLDRLQEQTGKVEGLSDVIATFADGSKESVAAIAGMANASEADLKRMVENYKKVQTEQEGVSDSLADLATDFSRQVEQLVNETAGQIEKLDLSDEAAANGRETLEAYAKAAEGKVSRVQSAFAQIRAAAERALGSASSVGASQGWRGAVSLYGYASGTQSAKRGVALVGEEGPELVYFNGGEEVLTAKETAALQREYAAATASPALTASTVNYTETQRSPINLTINVNGGASAETAEQIRVAGDELKAQLLQLLEEQAEDRARRVYA